MMSSNTIVWIAIAVAVAILLIVVAVVAIGARNRRRQRRAEEIREQARVATTRVEQREALAQETAAKARAAQAEAEVKAAEAARLQDDAAKHQSEAATSREQVQEQLDRAESIAPKRTKETSEAQQSTRDPDTAWGEESHEPATNAEASRPNAPAEAGNYRDADNYRARPE
jgi:FtsZ-interacting cell division protein ZipA